MKYDADGYSWVGRRPRLALPALVLFFPLFLAVGMLKGAWEGYDAWSTDLRDVIRRFR